MSIEKGEDWGERGQPPQDLPIFASSHQALSFLTPLRRRNQDLPAIGLNGGDLARTLGGGASFDDGVPQTAVRARVDLGSVLIDGQLHWFLDHLVARRSWWRGQVVAVSNAAFWRGLNIGPRSHPADGRFEVAETSTMALRDRLQVRKRMRSGSHVPHPEVSTRSVSAHQFAFAAPLGIWLDGHHTGEASSLSLRVEPDAVEVWV